MRRMTALLALLAGCSQSAAPVDMPEPKPVPLAKNDAPPEAPKAPAKLVTATGLVSHYGLLSTERSRVYPVQLEHGKVYVLSVQSGHFRPSVRLDDAGGKTVAKAVAAPGDGGVNVAATEFACNAMGVFSVVVSTTDRLGAYKLTVRERE